MLELFKLLGIIAIDNNEANESIDDTTGRAEKSEPKITTAFKKVGKALITYFSVKALTDFGEKLVSVAADAESSFAKVTTLMDTSTIDMTAYYNQMIAASSKTGVAFNEFSEAVYQAISASVDQASAVEFATKAVELSKAGFTDAATAVDVMTTAINAYGLSAEDAAHISDVLIKTQNLGKTTVDELAQSMGRVIPLASAYGVNIDNLSAAYAALTKGGIATAESTTYLRGMMTELANTGSTVAKTLQAKTGKSFTQLMESGKSLGEVLKILYDAAGNDSTAFSNMWSSVEAGTGALALANIGVEEFNTTLEAMTNSAGTTQDAYSKVTDTFNEKINKLKTSFVNLGISIADGVLPFLSQIVDGAISIVTFFSENLGPAITWIRDQFMLTFPEIASFVSTCFTDIKLFWENNLKPCFNAIGTFIKNILAPIFNTVFNGLIVPCINKAFSFIKDLWENVLKPVFSGIIDFITGVFSGSWEKAWQGIKSIFTGIINGILIGIEGMVNGAIRAINSLIEGINNLALVKAISDALGTNGIPTLPLVSLPRLEQGGVLERGQVGLLEGTGAEAVVPLDQNRKWISAVAEDMNGSLGGNKQVQELKEAFDEFRNDLPDMLIDAFTAMKFDVNNREFARLVKAVN